MPKIEKAPKSENGLTPIELVSARNLYVHHKNLLLEKWIKVLLVALALSLIANIVLGTKEQKNYFFATTPNGVITKIEPMDQPMLTNAQVASFAVEAVTNILSIDFAKYESQLSNSQEYFRPDSFRVVLEELRNSGYLKTVSAGKYIATAVPTEAPLIPREGKRAGVYSWEVTFPILVKLNAIDGIRDQTFRARVVVERAPAEIRPRCIAVTKLDLFGA